MPDRPPPPAPRIVLARTPGAPPNVGAIHRSVLAGFVTQIGVKGEEREYKGPRGLTFHLSPGSALFRQDPPWVVAAELVETTRRYARGVGRIRSDWVERVAPHLVRREFFEPHWLVDSGQVAAWERVSLHGLILVPKRRVPFGPIDPGTARDIFIQSALVEEQIATEGEFLQHNRELIEALEIVEAKKRSRDVLVDLRARFEFYDARIPPEIHSTPSFEKWRRHVERGRPRYLFMDRADLLQPGAEDLSAKDFPDSLELAGMRLPLDYIHEPGRPDDGVTVTVPIAVVLQLPVERLEWLVPGMLREKVIGLLRTLPKRVRVRFVPATDFADGAVESLEFGRGALPSELAQYLRRLTGTPIVTDDFVLAELPPHLRMNVRVIDGEGAEVATSRDVVALQRELGGRARASLHGHGQKHEGSVGRGEGPADRGAPRDPSRSPRPGGTTERTARDEARAAPPGGVASDLAVAAALSLPLGTRMQTFALAELPRALELLQGGMVVRAFPGLADDGTGAVLRLFADESHARRATCGGLRRLFALAESDSIRPMLDFMPDERGVPGIDALALVHAPLGPRAQLERMLIDRIAERAFLERPTAAPGSASTDDGGSPPQTAGDDGLVRTPAEFAAALAAGRPRLWDAGREVIATARQILEARQRLEQLLDAPAPSTWEPALADLREQVSRLLPPGFLLETPWEAFVHLPRYLAGALARLKKLKESGHIRDARGMDDVRPMWKRYLERRATLPAEQATPELDRYRWLVEEFRVSIFAQELRTAVPISRVRLEKQWERVE